MIVKCLHDDFLLDLTSYEISIQEENQWFNDQFFTKYSFPVDVDLTDDLNKRFGLVMDILSETPVTYFEVVLFIDDGHQDAILEVTDITDRVATVQFSFGQEQFPNWDRKLSELPLEVLPLQESMEAHASTIITQAYPAVNYNFVQVHTDSFDSGSGRWTGFEGIVNNYKNGAFLANEFDSTENVVYNRNLMLPMPYILHILKAGFAAAGHELRGDVLSDPELLKSALYKESEEYVNANIEGFEYVSNINSYDTLVQVKYKYGFLNLSSFTNTLGVYEDQVAFTKRGRYKISGVVHLWRQYSDAKAEVYFKGKRVYYAYQDFIRANAWGERVRYVDFNIDVDDLTEVLVLKNRQRPGAFIEGAYTNDATLWDLTITPLAIYDQNGVLVPPVVKANKVDLTKCVPDVTFGELVKAVKNWKNMDMVVGNGIVTMDYIEIKMDVANAIDLNSYNQRKPKRRFEQGNSFLLQFEEVGDFSHEKVYVNIKGGQTSGYTTDDNTMEIEVKAVPLPLELRNNVETAVAIDKGQSKILMVMYQGEVGKPNLAEDPTEALLLRTYEKHWEKWLDFRIKSQSMTTNFNAENIKMKLLQIDSRAYMYQKLQLIKTQKRTLLPGGQYSNYELELKVLK